MPSLQQWKGVLWVSAAAFVNVINLLISKCMENQRFPYYRMAGAGCLLSATALFVNMLCSWEEVKQSRKQLFWVFLRGLFGGALTFVFQLLAVSFGAPLGDVGALFSINVVLAAIQGSVILHEPMNSWHYLGVLLAVGGAVLISRPNALFGFQDKAASSAHDQSWLGYVLAIASAICMAQNFFCARKAKGVSRRLLTLSSLFQRAVALFLVVCFGFTDDHQLGIAFKAPLVSTAWLFAVTLAMLTAMFASAAGSVSCPAGVSAVVFTAVNMSTGYIAQTLLFNQPPVALTMVGAGIMLAAAAATMRGNIVSEPKAEPGEVDVDNESGEHHSPVEPSRTNTSAWSLYQLQDQEAANDSESGECSTSSDSDNSRCERPHRGYPTLRLVQNFRKGVEERILGGRSGRTIFRHFYSDDETAEGLVQRTLEATETSSFIKLTPEPYFMTLTFGGKAEEREANDVRPVLTPPVPPDVGGWADFEVKDMSKINLVLKAIRLLKSRPEARGKPVYVNCFSPFTVAMQCDPHLLDRLAGKAPYDGSERAAAVEGLHEIAATTAQYVLAAASAGADGLFFSNKALTEPMRDLFNEILHYDAEALAPLRAKVCRKPLDLVLHSCGSPIATDFIVQVLKDGRVYPANSALSWNLETGNPRLKDVLRTTDLRVFGTYPRHILHENVGFSEEVKEYLERDLAGGASHDNDWLQQHCAWLEKNGFKNRVIIGPDCCPGAFNDQNLGRDEWEKLKSNYKQKACC